MRVSLSTVCSFSRGFRATSPGDNFDSLVRLVEWQRGLAFAGGCQFSAGWGGISTQWARTREFFSGRFGESFEEYELDY